MPANLNPEYRKAEQEYKAAKTHEAMFRLLDVMRVYPKEPGKPPDKKDPFTVPVGATVLDFAARVHKDFARQLKSARVWGSAKFDGQVVQRDHVLQDADIVELTM